MLLSYSARRGDKMLEFVIHGGRGSSTLTSGSLTGKYFFSQFSRRFYGIFRALLNYILITDQIQIANTGYYLQFYLNIRDISIFCLKYHKNNVEVYYSLVVGIGKLHYILCLRIIRCLYCSADNCMFLQPAPARINKFISRL